MGKAFLIAGLAVAAVGAVAVVAGPIAQDPRYHDFADQRALLGIAHGADVLSNLTLSAAGLAGLVALLRRRPGAGTGVRRMPRLPWLLFFLGVALAGLGSGWYHLAPDNSRLFWDRLPMALAFGSLVAAVIDEGFGAAPGRAVLAILVPLGMASVVWWIWTEQQGGGDLRWYVLVQALPMVVIPVLLATRRAAYAESRFLWAALGAYFTAKGAEVSDHAVFTLSGETISGHTLKHLCAAAGGWLLFVRVRRLHDGCGIPAREPSVPHGVYPTRDPQGVDTATGRLRRDVDGKGTG